MQQIDVSVIVPVYRCEETLRKCLDSLLAQVGPATLEILIVNDGSPDNEQAIIDTYTNSWPHLFRSFNKSNGGLSDARNFGVKQARGVYIGFVDSDDYVEPEMFSALHDSASRYDADISIGRYWHHGLDGEVKLQCDLGWDEERVYHGAEFLLSQRSMVVWNKIYRRDLIRDRPQPVRWFEDVAWTPEIMTNAERVVFVNRGFYHYIRRPGSIASSHDDDRTLEGIGSVDLAVSSCNQRFKDHVQYMAIRRMLFEASVRPAYADRYYAKAQEILFQAKQNRFIQADDILQDKVSKIRDHQWAPIPKTIYIYPESSVENESWRINSLGYSDLEVIDLTRVAFDNNIPSKYLDLLEQCEAEALQALEHIAKSGGVYVGRGFEGAGPVAPLLIEEAFIALDADGVPSFQIFGGRSNASFMLRWYQRCLGKLESGSRGAVGASLVELVTQEQVRAPGRSCFKEVKLVSVAESWTGDDPSAVFKRSTERCSVQTSHTTNKQINQAIRVGTSGPESDLLMPYRDEINRLKAENTALSKRLRSELAKNRAVHNSVRWAVGRRFGFLEDSRIVQRIRYSRRLLRARSKPEEVIRYSYATLLNRSKIVPKSVLFESYYGRSIGSSPLALFEAWIQRPDCRHYSFTWVYEDPDEAHFPFQVPSDIDVSFVRRGSIEYYGALATSEYLLNDVTFFFDFVKRAGQKYINTWHSISVKSLGYDMPDRPLDQKNVVRNFLSSDYLVAANHFVAEDTFLRAHFLDGIFPGTILKTGQPRSDLTLRAEKESVESELQRVNTRPFRVHQRTIVYAPTWRGKNINKPSDDMDFYAQVCLALSLAFPDCNIVFRPHQISFNSPDFSFDGLLAPPSVDANRLFRVTDVLITDYSSIFYEFLVTRRPVAFLLHDLDDYRAQRGLYIDCDNLPGPVAFDIDTLVQSIEDILAREFVPPMSYIELADWSAPWDDGSVSARTLRKILDDAEPDFDRSSHARRGRSIALYPGALKGGAGNFRVHNAALALRDQGFEVSVLVDDSQHSKFVYTVKRLLDSGIRVIGRSPHVTFTRAEQFAVFDESNFGPIFPFRRLVERAFQREWRRCFGEVEFDVVVLMDRRSHAFSRLLARSRAQKVLWPEDSHFEAFGKEPRASEVWNSLYSGWDKVESIEELLDVIGPSRLEDSGG